MGDVRRRGRDIRLALTGFMGVGKSSVARHLSGMAKVGRVDLDHFIEDRHGRSIADIIDNDGEPAYRKIETAALNDVVLGDTAEILSLGGGTWTIEENRRLLADNRIVSVWLESSFEHCWYNIKFSRKDRPLGRNKLEARRLFDKRQKVYCLADWHFIVKPEFNSYEIAQQIYEQVYSCGSK